MLLLPPVSDEIMLIESCRSSDYDSVVPGSLEGLWGALYTSYLKYELLCMPFKCNGWWTAALKRPTLPSVNFPPNPTPVPAK